MVPFEYGVLSFKMTFPLLANESRSSDSAGALRCNGTKTQAFFVHAVRELVILGIFAMIFGSLSRIVFAYVYGEDVLLEAL